MELDDHISKYIDGELTEEEDVLLRKLLSEDDYAREKFDSAVSVHLAMKEDSQSIDAPEALLRQTEDIILMKILASRPIIIERPFLWRRSQVLAAMIVFFIFSFVFQIDDMTLGSLGKKLGIQISELSSENNEPETSPVITGDNLAASTGRIINNMVPPAVGRVSTNDMAVSSVSSAQGGGKGIAHADEIVISDIEVSADKKTEVMWDASPLHISPVLNNNIDELEDNESKPSVALYSTPSAKDKKETLKKDGRAEINNFNNLVTNKTKPAEIAGLPVPMKPGEKKTEVIFSSFLGTDFIRTGLGDGEKMAVTNFSQSLAYTIDNDEKLGIEIGYSEYAYKENVVLPLPYQPMSTGKTQMIETSEFDIPIGVDLFEYSMTLENHRQMVWGSAFYERSLIKSDDLSLEGRIGFGMSHDGPLGYGKLFGIYEFLDGFSVTVGTEGRLFQASLPGESVSRRLKSTATIIYGIQINF
ncbi:MAG: hypothetical protein M1419_08340 [Bacteroidetes bacterium]|nr:hypothetical protein [Bacteroidota bacterium]